VEVLVFAELMCTISVHGGGYCFYLYTTPRLSTTTDHRNFRPAPAYRDQEGGTLRRAIRLSQCGIAHITSSRSTNHREPVPDTHHALEKAWTAYETCADMT
jgi:hypothetical protein